MAKGILNFHRRRLFYLFVLIQVLFGYGIVSASPLVSAESCSRTKCPGSPGKFDYKPKTVYDYRYESDVTSYVNSTDRAQSRLHLSLKARLEVQSYCQITLQLQDVSLLESEPTEPSQRSSVTGERELTAVLEKYSLPFGFHDGKIGSLCPDPADPAWSLNIKRGILSALQNTMRRLDLDHGGHETDVSGTCLTRYQFEGVHENTFTVMKSRDLASCTDRFGHLSSIIGIPYDFPGGYSSLPLVNSTSTCRHTISGKVISQAECWEEHLVRPFSHASAGAVTAVSQSLTLLGTEELEVVGEASVYRRTTLLFDHQVALDTEPRTVSDVMRNLQQLCQYIENDMDPTTATSFGLLVEGLRSLAYPQISSLLEQSETLCRDKRANALLLHALISAGSSAAVAAMRDEVATGNVDSAIVEKWTSLLGFIPNPDRNHLVAALPLLDLPTSVRPHQSVLVVSALARRVCRTTPDCSSIPEMKMLVGKLTHVLGNSCETRPTAERDEIIVTLKALGNIGSAVSDEIHSIATCYRNQEIPAEIRVTAIQSLRNVPCGLERPYLKKILQDLAEDSEIRIHSYLGLMRCPSYETVTFLRDLLDNEEVNQVGSFIWTHLQNLAKTWSPSKIQLQALVSNQKFEHKFGSDARKFSRNFEASLLLDELNTAATVESNVIFSTKSYIPRSVMLNLTTDLFGYSVNLFEIGARLEGFEKTVESLFAPGGVYHSNEIKSFLENLRPKRKAEKTWASDLDTNKIDQIDRKFNVETIFDVEPQVSLSTKIMGNEVRYAHWEGLNELSQLYKSMKPLASLQKLMSGNEVVYSDASQFLDCGLVLPLSVGLPLNLTLKGQSVVDVRGKVRADVGSFFASGQGELTWSAQPSASVNIDAAMRVDAKVVKIGVKLNANLHTSVATSGQVTFKGLELVDFRFSFPQDKAEIINIKSEVILEHGRSRMSLTGIRQDRVEMSGCTHGIAHRLLGLQLCAELAYPNASAVVEAPHFPLTGPARLSLSLEKVDQNITGYRFLHKIENHSRKKGWALVFQAQGTGETRELGLKAHLDYDKGHGAVHFLLPASSYEVKGNFQWNDETKELDAAFTRDGRSVFVAQGSLARSQKQKLNSYLPRFAVAHGKEKLVSMNGEIRVTEKKGTSKYDANIDLSIGSWNSIIKGYFLPDGRSYVTNFTMENKKSSGTTAPNLIKLEMRLGNGTTKALRQYEAHLDVESSAYPQYNFAGSWKFQSADDHVENQISLSSGATVRDVSHQLMLRQSLTYVATLHGRRLKTKLEASLPSWDLDLLLALNHEKTETKTDSSFIGRYATNRQLEAGVLFEKKPGLLVHADMALNISLPQQRLVQLAGNLFEDPAKTYRYKANGVWGSATDFQLEGTYSSEAPDYSLVHDVDMELTGSSFPRVALATALYSRSNALKTKWQSSYGKDTMAAYLEFDIPAPLEWRINTNLGYLNYLHSASAHVKAEKDIETNIDIHIDRVRDIRLEFVTRDHDPRKQKEMSLELKWDANRDPSQKFTLKTSITPTSPHTNDLNATVLLTYPRRSMKGTLSTLTLVHGRSALLTLELRPGQILELTSQYQRNGSNLLAEVKLLSPFENWPETTAVFTSQTTDRSHVTHFRTSWGAGEFVDVHIAAEVQFAQTKALQAVFGMSSSVELLNALKASWNTTLTREQLENTVLVKWGGSQELLLRKSFYWDFKDQFKVGSRAELLTPFTALSKAQFSLEHITQWNTTFRSETGATLHLDQLTYTVLIKGENPISDTLWEATALITTPHAKYENLGLSVAVNADEEKPSALLTVDWPDNRLGFSGKLDYQQPGVAAGELALRTPFDMVKDLQVTGLVETLEPFGFRVNGTFDWNKERSFGLKGALATGPGYKILVAGDLQTPFEYHERYGFHVEGMLSDEATQAKGEARVLYRTLEAALKASAEMLDTDIYGSASLNLPSWPEVGLSMSYMEDNMTAVDITTWAGDQIIQGNVTFAQGESDIDVVVMVTTTFSVLPRFSVRLKGDSQKDEDEDKYNVSVAAKWMQNYNLEKDAGLHAVYRNLARSDPDTGESRELSEVTVELRTPWEEFKTVGVAGKLRTAGAQKAQNFDISVGNKKYSLGSLVNFDDQRAVLLFIHQVDQNKSHYRLNSTWQISEHEGIVVEGTVETPQRGYSRVPWKVVYNDIVPESEDGADTWEKNIKAEVKLPQLRPITLEMKVIPSEISAALATPFSSARTVTIRLPLVDWEEKDWNVYAEVSVNDKNLELALKVTWPEEGMIPTEIQLSMESSWSQLKMANLLWNLNVAETDTSVMLNVGWNDKQVQLGAGYTLNIPEKVAVNLKLTTPLTDHLLYDFDLLLEQISDGYSGKLLVATPFEPVRSVDWTLQALVSVSSEYRVTTALDWNDFSGNVEGKWMSIETGGLETGIKFAGAGQTGGLNLILSYDAEEYRHLKLELNGEFNSEWRMGISSILKNSRWMQLDWNNNLRFGNRKWMLDVTYDAVDVDKLYRHRVTYEAVHNKVKYSFYGRLQKQGLLREGEVGFDWQASRPLELKLSAQTKTKHSGNANAELITPWADEPVLVIQLDVDVRSLPLVVIMEVAAAQKKYILHADLKYKSLTSFGGTAQVKTPWESLPNFAISGNLQDTSKGFNSTCSLRWAESSDIDVHVSHQKSAVKWINKRDLQGIVTLSSSFAHLPQASLRYASQHPTPTNSQLELGFVHDSSEVFNMRFNTTQQSSAGRDVEAWELETRNIYISGGASYSYVFEYSGGWDGMNLPTTTSRSAAVYDIDKRDAVRLSTDYIVKETYTGESYALRMSTPSRTVQLSTHYDLPEGVFKHGSEFRLRPDVKFGYEIDIENRTTEAVTDYVFTTVLTSPQRSMGVAGNWHQTASSLRALTELVWDLKRKESAAKVTVNWENITKTVDVDSHRLRVGLSQGQLPTEIALVGEIHRSSSYPLNGTLELQYDSDSEKNAVLSTTTSYQNGGFLTELTVKHPATQLDVCQMTFYEHNERTANFSHVLQHLRPDEEPQVIELSALVDKLEPRIFVTTAVPGLRITHEGQVVSNASQISAKYQLQVDDNVPRIAEVYVNRKLPFAVLTAQYHPEEMKGLHFRGGVLDKRQIIGELWNQNAQEKTDLLDFYLRLDHPRLLTSRTTWRPTIGQEALVLAEEAWSNQSKALLTWAEDFGNSVLSEVLQAVLAITDDMALVVEPGLEDFIKESELLVKDFETIHEDIVIGYHNNSFYVKTVYELCSAIIKDIPFGSYAQSFITWIERTGDRIASLWTDSSDAFSRWLERTRDSLGQLMPRISRWLDNQFKWNSATSAALGEQVKSLLNIVGREYDKFAQRLQQVLVESLEEFGGQMIYLAEDSLNSIYERIRPVLLNLFLTVDNAIWSTLKYTLDYIYEQRDVVVQSDYFKKMTQLVQDLQTLYYDILNNNWSLNIRKYTTKISQFIQQKYDSSQPFFEIVDSTVAYVQQWWITLRQENSEFNTAIEAVESISEKTLWVLDYLELGRTLRSHAQYLLQKGMTLRETAIDAAEKYRTYKTKFDFSPEKGLVELEQKLPFPWLAFDEKPKLEEIPEYKTVKNVLQVFSPSNSSLIDSVYRYLPSEDVANWIPPFKGIATLTGLQHYVTFDGRYFEFSGPCTYLLSRDVYTKNFALAVKYVSTRGKPYAAVLQLSVDEAQWDLDLTNQTVRVAGFPRALPTEERGTYAYYESGKFVLTTPMKGITIECLPAYEACAVTVSGWYNNKVGGLFGTLDNELVNDQILPGGAIERDLSSLAQAWDVSTERGCRSEQNLARKTLSVDPQLAERCADYFSGLRSPLQRCFPAVDPAPYRDICTSPARKGAVADGCHAAAAYVQACQAAGVTVRMPSPCMKCSMSGGVNLLEGQTRIWDSEKQDRASSDIVVIIEAKKCHQNAHIQRTLATLVGNLEKELNSQKIIKNRYAVVVFGGAEPFDTPRIRTFSGQEFVLAKDVDNLLHNIKFGEGNRDVLSAIELASKLSFRPGASRTFLVVPCSACDLSQSKVQYSKLHQNLLNGDVSLHVLVNSEFRLTKPRASKQFLGMDGSLAFTRKDFKARLPGDADMRRQVKLAKDALGQCASLALETNGTIFEVGKLTESRRNVQDAKRAASVWSRRVSLTAQPSTCHNCACLLKNRFETSLQCVACNPRKPLQIDWSFLVDNSASSEVKPSATQRSGKNRPKEALEIADNDDADDSEEV